MKGPTSAVLEKSSSGFMSHGDQNQIETRTGQAELWPAGSGNEPLIYFACTVLLISSIFEVKNRGFCTQKNE